MAHRAYDESDLNILLTNSGVTAQQYTDGLVKYQDGLTIEELLERGLKYLTNDDLIRAGINFTLVLCKVTKKKPVVFFDYTEEGVNVSVAVEK